MKGTFWQRWLLSAEVTDDPVGDFIADARDDREMPPSFKSLAELRGYLRQRGACPGAMDATNDVWRQYQRWCSCHASGDPNRPAPTHEAVAALSEKTSMAWVVRQQEKQGTIDTDEWNGWRLCARGHQLVWTDGQVVELDRRFTTSDRVLATIMHISQKAWATDQCLAGLVRALSDVLSMTGVTDATDAKIDVRQCVKEAHAEIAKRRKYIKGGGVVHRW